MAFVICLASFAVRQVSVGLGAAIVALLAAGAALAWLTMEGRRVRQVNGTGAEPTTTSGSGAGYSNSAKLQTDLTDVRLMIRATRRPSGPLRRPPPRSAVS